MWFFPNPIFISSIISSHHLSERASRPQKQKQECATNKRHGTNSIKSYKHLWCVINKSLQSFYKLKIFTQFAPCFLTSTIQLLLFPPRGFSLSLCYILESLCQSLCLSLSHTVSLHFVQVLSLSLLHTPKQIFSLSLADTNMTLERSFWSVCLKRKQQWGPQPKG